VSRRLLRPCLEQEPFFETFGGGLFAESIRRAGHLDEDDQAGDKVEIGLRLLRELIEAVPAETWIIEADGHNYSGDYVGVEAMVVGHAGPGIPLAENTNPASTALDLVLIAETDRAPLATYLEGRLREGSVEPPVLTTHRVRKLRLSPPADSPLRIDDELLPTDEQPGGNTFSIRRSTTTTGLLVPNG
jgi:diacylglycerol kinase family enzyme